MENKQLLQKPDYDAYANWHSVTASKSVEQVKKVITGCPVWKETAMPKTVWASELGNAQNVVLDFGCGLGRNASMLRRYCGRVLGYDLDSMLSMLNSQPAPLLYDATSSNLQELLQQQVTHVYEAVVWQHIKWSSGATQLALDLITNQPSVRSIYSCWNAAVVHQSAMVAYLLAKGWRLEQSGEVAQDQLVTLANVPHRWYLFAR